MKLSELKPAEGSIKDRKRVGRGRSSGHGKTATRGQKGQKSRSGKDLRLGFEGGQMPITRRIPKLGGFKSMKGEEYQAINLDRLEKLQIKIVNPKVLFEEKVIEKPDLKVKILAAGEITNPITVQAHAFSKKAREKIEAVGGKAEVI